MYSILLHAPLFQKDYRGMAELKNIRIAMSGIYDYALEEIPTLRLPLPGQGAPEWAEKKRIYKIYRPAFVLAAACGKFKMLPLTHHHPSTPVDGRNFRKLAVGYTGENPFVDWIKDTDEVGIRSTVMIYDDEALDAYERGEIQLSPGYVASFEWRRGKAPDGQEYDIVMKEITDVNHLALLPAGRGGEYAVVMDGAGRERSVFELAKLITETRDSRKIYQIGEISEKTGLQKTANGWRPAKKDTGNSKKEEKTNDGAPYGNDNASKDHVNKEEAEAAKKRVFGKEFKGYSGAKAVEKLMQEKQGFIQGAFSRNDIGDIDVVYGEVTDPKAHKGYGLAHIFDKHPEITPETISEIIDKGTLEKTYNGYNLTFGRYRAGINNGYKENGKYVTTDNWIVTSFKINREKATGAIAYAADFTSDTVRPENLFNTEIVIHTAPKVKSVFEIAAGSVFDRARR